LILPPLILPTPPHRPLYDTAEYARKCSGLYDKKAPDEAVKSKTPVDPVFKTRANNQHHKNPKREYKSWNDTATPWGWQTEPSKSKGQRSKADRSQSKMGQTMGSTFKSIPDTGRSGKSSKSEAFNPLDNSNNDKLAELQGIKDQKDVLHAARKAKVAGYTGCYQESWIDDWGRVIPPYGKYAFTSYGYAHIGDTPRNEKVNSE